MVVSDTAIYIIASIIISLFVYMKISRMFASIMIFVIGIGILYVDSANGFTGYIVMASGFLMFVYSMLTPKNNGRKR